MHFSVVEDCGHIRPAFRWSCIMYPHLSIPLPLQYSLLTSEKTPGRICRMMDPREPALVASPGFIHGSRQPRACAHRRTSAVGFPYMDRLPGKIPREDLECTIHKTPPWQKSSAISIWHEGVDEVHYGKYMYAYPITGHMFLHIWMFLQGKTWKSLYSDLYKKYKKMLSESFEN